jgi:hypothetical protein
MRGRHLGAGNAILCWHRGILRHPKERIFKHSQAPVEENRGTDSCFVKRVDGARLSHLAGTHRFERRRSQRHCNLGINFPYGPRLLEL